MQASFSMRAQLAQVIGLHGRGETGKSSFAAALAAQGSDTRSLHITFRSAQFFADLIKIGVVHADLRLW
jgi:hypothetical protein